MKHLKLFENFSQDSAELKKAEEILGAQIKAEYYVFDIKDAPKSFEDTVVIYVPSTKTYHMMEKNKEMSSEDIVSLKAVVGSYGESKGKPYIQEGYLSTTDPHFIANLIKLGRADDQELNSEVYSWIEEELHSTDDSWDEIIKRLRIEGPELSDKDMKILGIDEKYKPSQTGKRYGV